MLGRALNQQGRYDEATIPLQQALAIQERVFGNVHPRVASTLNELGIVALRSGKLDEAEARFRRMAGVHREVYKDKHYYIGVALSNLAGVYQEKKEYVQAEQLFRDVLRRYAETPAADHQLVGIERIRLGRQLALQRRYAEVESESLAGYEILMKQTSPPERWLKMAREDLVAAYEAQKKADKAERFRSQRTGHASGSAATTASKR